MEALSPAPVAAMPTLELTRAGVLAIARAGERTKGGDLGHELLALARTDEELPPDLTYGRRLARAVLAARMAGSPTTMPPSWAVPPLMEVRPTSLRRMSERALFDVWWRVAKAAVELARVMKDPDALLRAHGVEPGRERVVLNLVERRGRDERPFAFLVTVARPGPGGEEVHEPLGARLERLADDPFERARTMAPIDEARPRVGLLRRWLASGELFHAVGWSAEEAHAFIRAAPELEAYGLASRLPPWAGAESPRPHLRVEVGAARPAALGRSALLDFQVRYFVGDEELDSDEWRALIDGAAGLRRVRDRWVVLDAAQREGARTHWEGVEAAARAGQVPFAEGMRLLAGMPRGALADAGAAAWAQVTPGLWLGELLAGLQSPAGSPEADPTPELRGALRAYQRDGVAWLWLLLRLGLGGCLADDMGLGKTIQVIGLLLLARRHEIAGPHLIVLPASLLGNWRAELARFGPDLRVYSAHRSAGDVDTAPEGPIDVVLTTYGTLLRQPWIQAQEWGLVVLDEAQAIKNADAKQTRAVKALSSRHRLLLTGTPVENSLTDLWSLFDFCNPGLLGGAAEFKAFARRCGPGQSELAALRALIRPYILRRLKSDRRVIADLPDKTEVQVYCGLTRGQAALYADAVQGLARELEGAGGIRRRGVILAALTRFKQICNHPSHYAGGGPYAPEESAKFMRLGELAEAIAAAGERALVFTQFRELCEPLARHLAAIFGRPGLVLHGGTRVTRRHELVEEFQRDDGPPFMVLSLKAGGTGLNLTAAGHVIHFDRWWNPAVENQATDRAYRIGQHQNVLVHKFVCRGTLEERIDAMLRDKQGLADGVLADEGERRLTELGTDELMQVVSLDLRAALAEE